MAFCWCCLAFFVRICILLRFLDELGLYYVSSSSEDELGLYYVNSSSGDDEDSSSDSDSSSSSEEYSDSEESVKKSRDSVKDSLEKLKKAQESLDKKDPDNKNLQELQDKHSRELKDTDDAQDFLDKVSRKLKDKFENLKKKAGFFDSAPSATDDHHGAEEIPDRLAQLQKEFGKEEGRKKYEAFDKLSKDLKNKSPWGDSKKEEKKDSLDTSTSEFDEQGDE